MGKYFESNVLEELYSKEMSDAYTLENIKNIGKDIEYIFKYEGKLYQALCNSIVGFAQHPVRVYCPEVEAEPFDEFARENGSCQIHRDVLRNLHAGIPKAHINKLAKLYVNDDKDIKYIFKYEGILCGVFCAKCFGFEYHPTFVDCFYAKVKTVVDYKVI